MQLNLKILKDLYYNKALQEQIALLMRSEMDTEILKSVYKGESVEGYDTALHILTKSFSKLNDLFKEDVQRPVDKRGV